MDDMSGKVSNIVDNKGTLCDGCKYYSMAIVRGYKKFPHCKLQNLSYLPNQLPKNCKYKNLDTTDMKICRNCKNFDYKELRCKHDYYRIVGCMDDACKEFEMKDTQ